MFEYDPYLAISLFGHLFPGIAKNAFQNIQNFLVLVSRGLSLIAVNMHYAKFTLWTPKLQILANFVKRQNFVVASRSSMLQQVELASAFLKKCFQLATTTFCCLGMFEVGGNTCNNAFQLATQQCYTLEVEEECCPYYRAFRVSINPLHWRQNGHLGGQLQSFPFNRANNWSK